MDYLKEMLTFGEIIRDLGLHLHYRLLYDFVHCVNISARVPGRTLEVNVFKDFKIVPEDLWKNVRDMFSGLEYSWSDPDRGIDEFTITLPEFKTAKELKMKLSLMGK